MKATKSKTSEGAYDETANGSSVIEAMAERAGVLKIRLFFATIIATAACLLMGSYALPLTWLVLMTFVQVFDRTAVLNLIAEPDLSDAWKQALLLSICFVSSSCYGAIAHILWLHGTQAAQIGAIVFLVSAVLHIQNFTYRSRLVFAASCMPYVGYLVAALWAEYRGMSGYSLFELVAMSMLGAGFIVNVRVAYLHSRAVMNQANFENARAKKADALKSAFLATMSHELRTPLNAIIGYSELLRDELEGDVNQVHRQDVAKIERSGRHLLGLINNILDHSKIEADGLTVEAIPTDPAQIVQEVVETIKPQLQLNDNLLKLDIAPMKAVLTDPTRLKQCLLNLVSNATKFTSNGTITVRAWQSKQGLSFEIKDDGIGMSPVQVSRVFDAFAQADGDTTRRFGGTGLGLPITRSLAQLMGGDVSVVSHLGEGAAFTLWITAHQVNEDVPYKSEIQSVAA